KRCDQGKTASGVWCFEPNAFSFFFFLALASRARASPLHQLLRRDHCSCLPSSLPRTSRSFLSRRRAYSSLLLVGAAGRTERTPSSIQIL
ncbi:unnamed protein product, partial [Brassica oleracea]